MTEDTRQPVQPAARRILLVADDLDQVSLFSLVLTQAGFEVVSVIEAEEALKLLESDPFDLVLTDYMLPGMQGDELIRTIQQRHYPVKTIMMSTHLDIRSLARESNADAYDDKMNLFQMVAKVKKLLGM